MSTPAPTINGQSGAHEQPLRYGFDENGYYTVRTYHGTRTAIANQYLTCVSQGATCEVRQGIGVDILEARYAGSSGGGSGDPPVDTWEFFANVVEKDALESDVAAVAAISLEDRITIQNWSDPMTAPAGLSTAAQDVFVLRMRGTKSIRVMQPMLRHTLTVSNAYTVKAALTNVGKILTNAQLSSAESLPGTVLFNLPTAGTAGEDEMWGWLKMHPTVRVAAGQKMQIEQEWEWGLWTTILYSAAQ